MTANEFNQACTERLIAPAIALENTDIVAALHNRDDGEVVELLDTLF